tara:strand:- start:367 stop:678 length:312 start_codon:yes stop_codon:yes gene_type:complete
MTFETHNETTVLSGGTCLQGYITIDFDKLVAVFGEPCEGDQYKVDWEWEIEFDDGTVATVYNWKNGPSYCGEQGLNQYQIKEWHVGGRSRTAVNLVENALNIA